MRWKGLLIGFGLLLVAATACGQRTNALAPDQPANQPGGPSATASPPATSTPGPPPAGQLSPPAGGNALAGSQVDFSALPAGFPREVWVSGDDKTVYIRAEEGGCGRAGANLLEESAQRVVISLIETQSQLKGQMCPMIISYPVVSVPLSAPLGQRTVVLSSAQHQN
jgi:hypothetical protein